MRNHGRSGTITAVVADSTRMGCEGIVYALRHSSHDITVLEAAVSCRELVEIAKRTAPNIAVISTDLEDGPGAGIVVLRELRQQVPNVRCVILVDSHTSHLVVEAFCAGTRGVVCRSEGFEVLADCIRKIHAGEMWAGSIALEHMVRTLNTAVPVHAVNANGSDLLTARQKQVVALVGEGLSNREISTRLNLSEHTTKNYLFRIFDKLGVSSRAELIIYALHNEVHFS